MTIALCHGTFDILHPGHLSVFHQARYLAERVIITLTADPFIDKIEGQPFFSHWERAEMVRSHADAVYIIWANNALQPIEPFRPEFFVKGGDYASVDKAGNLASEKKAVEAYGGRVVLVPHTGHSTSGLVHRIRSSHWQNAQE